MVKTTNKSDLPWSAIFGVIVYCHTAEWPATAHLAEAQISLNGDIKGD